MEREGKNKGVNIILKMENRHGRAIILIKVDTLKRKGQEKKT